MTIEQSPMVRRAGEIYRAAVDAGARIPLGEAIRQARAEFETTPAAPAGMDRGTCLRVADYLDSQLERVASGEMEAAAFVDEICTFSTNARKRYYELGGE